MICWIEHFFKERIVEHYWQHLTGIGLRNGASGCWSKQSVSWFYKCISFSWWNAVVSSKSSTYLCLLLCDFLVKLDLLETSIFGTAYSMSYINVSDINMFCYGFLRLVKKWKALHVGLWHSYHVKLCLLPWALSSSLPCSFGLLIATRLNYFFYLSNSINDCNSLNVFHLNSCAVIFPNNTASPIMCNSFLYRILPIGWIVS